jgi:hypothetical protein
MKYKSLGLTALLVALAGSALAQTQISGTLKCDSKPVTSQSIEVGDHPGHIMVLSKGSCTWTAPLEIAGLKSTAYSGAGVADVDGAKGQDRGYAVITMDNGDKAYARYQDTGTGPAGGTITFEGTWSFAGGTGKLKGLKGKGTYKGSTDPNTGTTDQIEGEYTLPGTSNPPK